MSKNQDNKIFKTKFFDIYNFARKIYKFMPLPKGLKLRVKNLFLPAIVSNSNKMAGYDDWIKSYECLSPTDRTKIDLDIRQFQQLPLISVVMPVYNTPAKYLEIAIESVRKQIYPHWELCIADNASSEPHVHEILSRYLSKDSRIKVVFRESNGHICASSNSAIELASGEFIALLDSDDALPEYALYFVAREIVEYPEVALIYSDEDKIDPFGHRYDPYFKSDWNPDLLRSQNMISHLGVYRTELVRSLGGFRLGYEGSQDWDLALRVSEVVTGAQIRHIPRILYHWRAIPGSGALDGGAKDYAKSSGRNALIDHCARTGRNAEVLPAVGTFFRVKYALTSPAPKVSLIMPSKCQLQYLRPCLESFLLRTEYTNFEILLLVNEIRWKDSEKALYLNNIQKDPRVRVLSYPDQSFNFSKINNWAASMVDSDIIGFVNDDLEAIMCDWLTEMVSQVSRPDVAVVGAKLYYPNDTIQHAGVGFWLGGVANHRFRGMPRGFISPFGISVLLQNVGCVTAGCMLVKKDVFKEVGGFDEKLAVAFNDVDFCHKVIEKGYFITWTPYAELYHHESVSVGPNHSPERKALFEWEVNYMFEKWKKKQPEDPFYNPNLSNEFPFYRLAIPPRLQKPWEEAESLKREGTCPS